MVHYQLYVNLKSCDRHIRFTVIRMPRHYKHHANGLGKYVLHTEYSVQLIGIHLVDGELRNKGTWARSHSLAPNHFIMVPSHHPTADSDFRSGHTQPDLATFPY